jgi:uncharacterized protein DUF4012
LKLASTRIKIALGISAVIAIVVGMAVYVAIPLRRDLLAAQSVMSVPLGDIGRDDIEQALDHLKAANRRLSGVAPAVLRLVPVARQNINAVDGIVDASIPVLEEGHQLTDALHRLESGGLVEAGHIRLDAIQSLRPQVGDQVATLSELNAALDRHTSGWLLPPVWDAFADFSSTVQDLSGSTLRADAGLEILGRMLGSNERRDYLVLLLNNAELRGAGGILSGIGSFSVVEGKLGLGPFYYHSKLSEDPPRRVDAPEDFKERFARYWANSTEWVNASASPDVPDVATVAGELFRLTAGGETDGAVVIDARGLAALLPPKAEVPLPGEGQVSADGLPQYVYSDSYEELGQSRRRRAVLELGEAAFRTIITDGFRNRSSLEAAGAAVSGGHIRVVSFDTNEQETLARLGVSGELTTDAIDKVLITVQNLGGDKLDFWMRRTVTHECVIVSSESARCTTTVLLRNETPRGLHPYVVQGNKPYGHYFGYLELYVPHAARLLRVTKDTEPVKFFREGEEGWTSAGFDFDIPRKQSMVAEVIYDLPLDQRYSLDIVPQPLTHDARLRVSLTAPDDWNFDGPGSLSGGSLTFRGRLDRKLSWSSAPVKTSGLSSVWDDLVRFWNEPVF